MRTRTFSLWLDAEAIWKEGTTVDYGAHLPVIDFGFYEFSLERLCVYVRAARDLGFKAVSTNDHLIHSRPWLDAPTALAAILPDSGNMAVGTSVILTIVRGPGANGKGTGCHRHTFQRQARRRPRSGIFGSRL
jgi:hypothetical protein